MSLVRVIVNQKETIQKYQTLSNLHTQMQEIQSKLNEQINQVKQQTSKHLDRIDRQAITTYTTISEIKSQIHKIESSLEGQNLLTEQSERQGFIFPEDIVELHAPDSDENFHSEEEATTTVTGIEERQTQQPIPEQSTSRGHTINGSSSETNYIPAGAELQNSIASSEGSVSDSEAMVEEGKARFFDNPSYRAGNPELQTPVDHEVEENWDEDTTRENVNNQIPTENHQSARFKCRQQYL